MSSTAPHIDIASAAATFSIRDIRVIIKFIFLQGNSSPAIHATLSAVLSDKSPSLRTVQRWVASFQSGEFDVEDDDRSGRPSTAHSETNVALVESKIKEDRRITLRALAEDTGLSHGTVERIVSETLGLRRVVAKWIPHILTEEQKNCRVVTCRQLLRRHRKEGDSFLERIVAGDETWCHSFEPELKTQSSEWHHPSSPRPQKARRSQGAKKVLHVIFYDYVGILLDWPVPVGTTVTGDYYRWILNEKLRPSIRKKRSDLLERKVILLHDNASPHCKANVVDLLESWDWEILSHPAYSPDLSPCDFHLFPRLKNLLRGKRFSTEEDINKAVATALKELQRDGVCAGIKNIVERWHACITNNGDYFE